MIIVSIALMKSRLGNVKTIVDDIMAGEVIPDRIYFFVSREPHNLDEGIRPDELPTIYNDRVEYIYTPNIGSLRKFIPIVQMYWSRPNTRIIMCDDDRKIQPDTFKKLIDYSEDINHRFHSCGTAGNIFTKEGIECTKGRIIVLGWSPEMKEPRQVDLLNSGMMTLIKPKFFDKNDIINWEKYLDPYKVNKTDENFISYLLAKHGIPRFVVPIDRCPTQLTVTEQLHCSVPVEGIKFLQVRRFHRKMMEWQKDAKNL